MKKPIYPPEIHVTYYTHGETLELATDVSDLPDGEVVAVYQLKGIVKVKHHVNLEPVEPGA
jgi:hypothetical protein